MENLKEFRSTNFIYDIFGYFLPGFFLLCLFVIDFDLGAIFRYYSMHGNSLQTLHKGEIHYKMQYLFQFLTWNTDTDFKFTTFFILIIFCYLIGHIIAAISSQVLEVWINYRLLGFPSENLIKQGNRSWFQKIFKTYTKSLDPIFINEFNSLYTERFGPISDRKSCFWLCFSEVAANNPVAYNRVIHFLNLYGFSRNVSACLLTYTVSRLIISSCTLLQIDKYNYTILILFFCAGLMMFKNYLKLFYRQCSELYYHFYASQKKPQS